MIELQNIKKTYHTGRRGECHALKGVSCSLPDCGMVFVLGKSGSGKSTLLNIIGGLDSSTEGEMLIDGNRFSSLAQDERDDYRNLYVGFVFQDFCLIDGLTVTENVRLSVELRGESDDETVEALISDVGLSAECSRYPRELSGGQWQKLAIARAFYADSDFLILDEPTAALDPLAEQEIYNQFARLGENKTTIFVSHRLSSATTADQIIVLKNGELIENGVHSELMALKGDYYTLFTTQAERYLEDKS